MPAGFPSILRRLLWGGLVPGPRGPGRVTGLRLATCPQLGQSYGRVTVPSGREPDASLNWRWRKRVTGAGSVAQGGLKSVEAESLPRGRTQALGVAERWRREQENPC